MARPAVLFCLFAILFCAGPEAHADTVSETIIHFPQQEAAPDLSKDYFLAVLDLALRKTVASDGPFRLQASDMGMPQGRALDLVISQRNLDVVWTVTSTEREQQLLPVRIPLEKGLFGYRVMLIRAIDQQRFAAVKTLADLATFTAGQGHDWPDTTILRANGLHVETNSNYPSSFQMLAHKRFDYFPRSVSEIHAELALHPDMGLAIEQKLLLHYPSAMYFFVGKDNSKLAIRLEAGLRRAIADGSFDRLFNSHNAMKEALKLLKDQRRLVLELDNPLLPPHTPIADKSLWFSNSQNRN